MGTDRENAVKFKNHSEFPLLNTPDTAHTFPDTHGTNGAVTISHVI